ncbi:zinc finger, CCHC-type, retrotransposon gag domain protein [Tanacetum coccineum]
MEKIFDVMDFNDAFKTRLAVYKFEGDALAWWKAYKQAKRGDAWVLTLTWAAFKELFFLQFFPRAEQERLKRGEGFVALVACWRLMSSRFDRSPSQGKLKGRSGLVRRVRRTDVTGRGGLESVRNLSYTEEPEVYFRGPSGQIHEETKSIPFVKSFGGIIPSREAYLGDRGVIQTSILIFLPHDLDAFLPGFLMGQLLDFPILCYLEGERFGMRDRVLLGSGPI